MSDDFNGTPIVIGNNPTTYGEMRAMVATTLDRSEEEWIGVLVTEPFLLVRAMCGAANGIKHLLDVIEQLTNNREEAQSE